MQEPRAGTILTFLTFVLTAGGGMLLGRTDDQIRLFNQTKHAIDWSLTPAKLIVEELLLSLGSWPNTSF